MDIKQKIIISTVAAVVVLGVIGYGIWGGGFNRFLKYQGQQGKEKTVQTPEGEIKGIEVAPGTSLINEDGTVVLNSGKRAENSVEAGTPSAPQQSNPVAKNEIPSTVIKISASAANGFTPKTFEVRASAPVSISVTSEDGRSYVFAFRDESLQGVAVGVGPGDTTRVISFNAPSVKGEYAFYSNIPSQSQLPKFQGKMIVK